MAVHIISNPVRTRGLPSFEAMASGQIETDASAAIALYEKCPIKHTTPLLSNPTLASRFGIAELWLKMEDQRMGLGSFKALGAAFAIAKMAASKVDPADADAMATALSGTTFICASAGNHGLSLAAGAKLFGASAVVVLSQTVPESFAQRLRDKGAEVKRAGENYEESLETSKELAAANGWNLLADGSWEGYSAPSRDIMEGYLIMGHEVADQMHEAPTHIFLQAGVGGLATGAAAAARERWGADVKLIVVEPQSAPALIESVKAGKRVDTTGPVSTMGRLDCKTPSDLALKYLAVEADCFLTIDDERVDETVQLLSAQSVETTPSGGAGVAALQHGSDNQLLGLQSTSRVLCYISEGTV